MGLFGGNLLTPWGTWLLLKDSVAAGLLGPCPALEFYNTLRGPVSA